MEEVFCLDCGKGVGEGVRFRPDCGHRLKKGFAREERESYVQELEASHEAMPENTSGQGDSSIVPETVKGWNGGAFTLT